MGYFTQGGVKLYTELRTVWYSMLYGHNTQDKAEYFTLPLHAGTQALYGFNMKLMPPSTVHAGAGGKVNRKTIHPIMNLKDEHTTSHLRSVSTLVTSVVARAGQARV